GQATWDGWVPPIPGRDRIATEEAATLATLETIKQALITLAAIPERQQYAEISAQFNDRLQEMTQRHQQRKTQRECDRQLLSQTDSGDTLATKLEQLNQQSRLDGIEKRNLKRDRDRQLTLLQQRIAEADRQMQALKRERQERSRQLQTQMHANYQLMNFLGTAASLQELWPTGLPTGTGDCCAPKLLHYAATHHLKPLALAEFWWGAAQPGRVPGQFYGACAERCQPIMGFLLSGLSPVSPLPIIYEDDWIIVVDKPAGLLSVPGRSSDRQDSVLTRIQNQYPDLFIQTVHRLDQETSGLLMLSRDRHTHRHLYQQFQQRQVKKIYEALLAHSIEPQEGQINLPLWSDPSDRPKQKVDAQRGKPSLTQFRLLSTPPCRIEFTPITGRTHQLRVHALEGLGACILGDRLYGDGNGGDRLYLHAKALQFRHPETGQMLELQSKVPF
ncbi:MAG: pseudouridine synthase, partial [Oculatellaceae cyanobacterium Prado106]|nr:pseudouridine synthase [Oculatellaceae cyanobacterium Prado106]